MAQYVPDVAQRDIERVVRRDFPPGLHASIHELIREIDVREKTRVMLACLKNANGDFEKLRGELTNAAGYWREIIGEAEYPNYTKAMSRIDELSADERARVAEQDKDQYLTWLNRAGTGSER